MSNKKLPQGSALRQMAENAQMSQKKSENYADRIASSKVSWQEQLRTTLYDSATGAILTRTPKSWFLILGFYVVFYAANGLFFYGMMKAFIYGPLKPFEPTYTLDESCIGSNPGLAFKPIPDDHSPGRGSLLWYSQADLEQIDAWTKNLDRFLKPYQKADRKSNQISCNFETKKTDKQICVPDLHLWDSCNSLASYGYNESSPCFVLVLNRITNWEPDYYEQIEELPTDMPDDLVKHIKGLDPSQRKQMWVSCQAEQPVDNEQLSSIQIVSDRQGFPSFYYPFTNAPGYLSPLVAIKVNNPPLNVILNIECRVWAKNIVYNGGADRQGSVHIEFMIDDKTPPKKKAPIPRI
jgi:sodium/potassium-transporting ATPase subunit beta